MKKRNRILLVVLLVAALGSLIWLMLRSNEPVYQAKSLSVWLEQYSTNRWPLDKQAEAAIRHIGTNAVPILLKRLSTREDSLKMKLLARVPKQWLVRLHLRSVDEYRLQVDNYRTLGANGFMALGVDARPAVPALIALLNDKDLRVRYLAVFALRCLGPVASDALPSMINCLDDPDFAVRDDAVTGLGTIHQEPERVVPILINFIEKNRADKILCQDAIGSLGMFGEQAKPAIPILLGFLNHQEASALRGQVLRALVKIHAKPELVVPALMASLHDSDAEVQKFSIIGLGAFGADAKLAVPALIDSLIDPNDEVRILAVDALGQIHVEPELVVPALEKALHDPSAVVCLNAAKVLKQIDPEAAARAGIK
jgi:HEAT repeat protein